MNKYSVTINSPHERYAKIMKAKDPEHLINNLFPDFECEDDDEFWYELDVHLKEEEYCDVSITDLSDGTILHCSNEF